MRTEKKHESVTSLEAPELASAAPAAASFDRARFKAAMRIVHDIGGEEGGPISLEERETEPWEVNTYALCECLAWRGVWTNVEKLRRGADLGDKYFSLPYSGRWLLAAARALIDKDHITLTELTERIEEVRRRYAQKPPR